MRLFKCNHRWRVAYVSNALQQDYLDYPLRLCICECSKCGKSDQQWIDVSEKCLDELETGKSFLLEWRKFYETN